jgi:hypothetical protein
VAVFDWEFLFTVPLVLSSLVVLGLGLAFFTAGVDVAQTSKAI